MTAGAIIIIPVGEVPQDLIRWLKAELAQVLNRETSSGRRIDLRPAWYDRQRQQVRGPALLCALEDVPRRKRDRILGLADVDCYAAGLNFIFGQASPRKGAAFVALPRLRPSFYGLPDRVERFRERTLKEAIHELGHTWGLSHCPNPRCVMHFSNTLADTDAKRATFCERCKRRMGMESVAG